MQSFNSSTSAPRIAGIDIKNEYFTAKLRLKPLSRHAVIVVPERDNPGSVAIPCAIPTPNAFVYVTLFGNFSPSLV